MNEFLPAPIQQATAAPVQLSAGGVILNLWLANLKPTTRASYQAGIEDLRRFTRAVSLEAVADILLDPRRVAVSAMLQSWRADLLERRGRAPGTVNNRLASVRSFLAYAYDAGVIDWHIRVKDVKAEQYRDTAGPGLQRMQCMFERAAKIPDYDVRIRALAIIRLLFDLGLREAEVVALDLCDVDLEEGKLRVLGKGRRERAPMTMPTETARAVATWIKIRGHHQGALFTILSHNKTGCRITTKTVYRLVRDLGEAMGIRTSPHKIRHTAITVVAGHEGLLAAQKFARHSDPKITMRYVDNMEDVAGKAAAKLAKRLVPRENKPK